MSKQEIVPPEVGSQQFDVQWGMTTEEFESLPGSEQKVLLFEMNQRLYGAMQAILGSAVTGFACERAVVALHPEKQAFYNDQGSAQTEIAGRNRERLRSVGASR
jgi:hypothetical protein